MTYYKELGKKLREHHKIIEQKVETLKTEVPDKLPPEELNTFYEVAQTILEILDSISNIDNTSDVDKPISTAQQAALNNKVPITRTINGKALSDDIVLTVDDIDTNASEAANTALANAKAYTNEKIDEIVGEGASETLNTIGEISQAFEEHQEVVEALNAAIGSKASNADLTSHTGNANIHINNNERTSWNNKAEHEEIIGENLIPYPYYHSLPITNRGITFEDYDGNGGIIANGTNDGSGLQPLFICESCKIMLKANQPYTFASNCTDDRGFITVWFKNTDKTNVTMSYTEIRNGITSTVTSDHVSEFKNGIHNAITFIPSQDTYIQFDIRFDTDVEGVTDAIFYPMLVEGKVIHPWQPYNLSRKGIIEQIVVDNLLTYPYFDTTQTIDGIVWTDLGDGTVKANGTNTSEIRNGFVCKSRAEAIFSLILEAGTYTFSGCPIGGSSLTYYVEIGRTLNGSFNLLGYDYGNGTTFTVSEDTQVQIILYICPSITVSNILFKPMLIKGSVARPWQPYSLSRERLREDIDTNKTKLDSIDEGANKYTHPTYTARTGKPTSNQTPAFGDTVTVSQITSDATGHVTNTTDKTIKIPNTLSNGTGTAGLIKTSSEVTSNSGYTACPVINGVPYYKDTDTNTKNTAGSTNSSKKLFLIGAESQAANPQTYSRDTAYVGADGCVYSGGKKTSVEGHSHDSLNGKKLLTEAATDTWDAIPYIDTKGVMEIGKYIDFHTTDGNTADYDVRITADTKGLTLGGKTNLVIDQNLKIADDGGVSKTVIQVKNPTPDAPVTSGSEVLFGGGGNVFVGAGESYTALRNAMGNSDTMLEHETTYGVSGERLYLSADSSIKLYSDCNTIANRKAITMSNGHFYPNENEVQNLGSATNNWRSLYASERYNLFNNEVLQGYIGVFQKGTTSQEGQMRVVLGNGIATGNADNSSGGIVLFGKNEGYTYIIPSNDTTNNVDIHLPETPGTLALNTVASTSADGLISKDDKTKLDNTNIAYGTCSTAAATAAKIITISGNTKWALKAGSTIVVKFTNTNTAQNPTFNVNNTGAKKVWYNTALITTSSLGYAGTANRPMQFVYDGTQFVFMGWSVDIDTNTKYTNASLGQGYGTCTTAEATVAKVVTLSNYTLTLGGMVSVKFTYAVPASATMNINSKGAKNIFYRGAAITAGIINAGDIATFIYDGTQYHLISIDKGVLNNTAIGALGFVASTAPNLVPTVSTIAFWNGAYSGTKSNLAYCSKGAFGSIVTKNTGDYLPITGGNLTGGLTIAKTGTELASGETSNMLAVSYKDAGGQTFTTYPIRVVGSEQTTPYNAGVLLGSHNGTTILASGESSQTMPAAVGMYNNENLYLSADNNIIMYAGCSNDASTYHKALTIDTNGNVTVHNKLTASNIDITTGIATTTSGSTCSMKLTEGRSYIISASDSSGAFQCMVVNKESGGHMVTNVFNGNGSSNNSATISGNTLTINIEGCTTGFSMKWIEY